jgi:hypothetical protein
MASLAHKTDQRIYFAACGMLLLSIMLKGVVLTLFETAGQHAFQEFHLSSVGHLNSVDNGLRRH